VSCVKNICGDGELLIGTEECDDANQSDADACLNTCKVAKCGDGKVQAGIEKCDDANMDDADACSNACVVNGLRVFVTSFTSKGNLGGIGGANTKCQNAANGKQLGGTWKAWVSKNDTSPGGNFTKSAKPYYRLDLVKVADDWNDLVDGSLDATISVDESGAAVMSGTSGVWTGTKTDASPTYTDCFGWTSSNYVNWGTIGRRNETNGNWTDDENVHCSDDRRLYCVEQ
ncbi:MAG TPA: DUF4215 domain-containing protein, partial [Nannocystaceae bacterium]|nr:DUF4215 domain-containing protein [Nannocystaceae bacterium]